MTNLMTTRNLSRDQTVVSQSSVLTVSPVLCGLEGEARGVCGGGGGNLRVGQVTDVGFRTNPRGIALLILTYETCGLKIMKQLLFKD